MYHEIPMRCLKVNKNQSTAISQYRVSIYLFFSVYMYTYHRHGISIIDWTAKTSVESVALCYPVEFMILERERGGERERSADDTLTFVNHTFIENVWNGRNFAK